MSELAAKLNCRLIGEGGTSITGVTGMEQAGSSQLTFLANPKYAHKVKDTQAGAILLAEHIPTLPIPQLISTNPYLDFARALALFYQPPRPPLGVHPSASVADSARIGENASIGAFAVVGENVVIGKNAVLHPHVVIYDCAHIGDDFLAHSHAVVREFCRVGHRV
ncbi:MAG: LpxD N-terminal domain-containing protein, partial [Bryobacteraceae bacterium]